MDWVREFYSTAATWWSPAERRIGERDQNRAELVTAYTGGAPARVLDLGAGYGTTATALAQAGHEVTAVEVSDAAQVAREVAAQVGEAGPGSVRVIEADFYQVELPGGFDVVCYWDGFGVGSDSDQHRLLHRIAHQWLRPGGTALVDVFNPFVWARWDGDLEHKPPLPELGYQHELYERCSFDPITCTATDTWWPASDPSRQISQHLRCYTPADLSLLLAGTGLALREIVVAGQVYPPASGQPGLAALLREEDHYVAVLRPVDDSARHPSP